MERQILLELQLILIQKIIRFDNFHLIFFISDIRELNLFLIFQTNYKQLHQLVDNLKNVTENVLNGGGQDAIKRHTSKGKLLARQRIDLLLDKGSPFLELAPLAGHELYGKEVVNSGGIITGIGRVQG